KRVHSIEIEINLTSAPIVWHLKRTAIRAYLVSINVSGPVLRWRTHHTSPPIIHLNTMFKDYLLVYVYRNAILERSVFLNAIDVPAHGHRHLIPLGNIIRFLIKILRPFVRMFYPMELPRTIEILIVAAILRQYP